MTVNSNSWYNNAFETLPSQVYTPRQHPDFQTALNAIRQTGETPVLRVSGHGIPGDLRGSSLVDASNLRDVRVDPRQMIATIQAGARWGDVAAAAGEHGLIPMSGSAPSVGVLGYLLEGGIGLLARKFGYSARSLRSVRLLTAAGEVLTVSADENPDVLWALRGAGSNFGIVISAEIQLLEHPNVDGGGFYYQRNKIADVAHGWLDWTRSLTDDTTSSLGIVPFPSSPSIPEPVRGDYGAHVRVAHINGVESGDAVASRLVPDITPAASDFESMTWVESSRVYNDPPVPMGYVASNILTGPLSHANIDSILEFAGPSSVAGPFVTQINHLGGALGPQPNVMSAGRHGAEYALRLLTRLEPGSGERAANTAKGVHHEIFTKLGIRTIGTSLNFSLGQRLTADEVASAFEPEALSRLLDIKRRLDPDNVFSNYHSLVSSNHE